MQSMLPMQLVGTQLLGSSPIPPSEGEIRSSVQGLKAGTVKQEWAINQSLNH